MADNKRLTIELKPAVKLALKPWLVVKLAENLTLREEEVVNILTDIEQSDEFQKLVSLRIITRKPFSFRSNSSTTGFYEEYKDEITFSPLDTSEIYEIINQHPEIVKTIKKIGEENYKKYFLGYETYSFEEIAKYTNISIDEVKQIAEFTNKILIYSEMETSTKGISSGQIPDRKYVRVAKVSFVKQHPVITYYLTSMLRGEYNINYEQLNKVIANLSPQERRKIRKLIKDIEIINVRKTTLHKIIETLVIVQKEFLITGLPHRRKVLTQKELAQIISVDPSVVCRIIKDKTIIGPLNKEYTLTFLTPNKKEILLQVVTEMMENKENRRLTDNELCKIIAKNTGFSVSRRTVNYYRNLIKQKR